MHMHLHTHHCDACTDACAMPLMPPALLQPALLPRLPQLLAATAHASGCHASCHTSCKLPRQPTRHHPSGSAWAGHRQPAKRTIVVVSPSSRCSPRSSSEASFVAKGPHALAAEGSSDGSFLDDRRGLAAKGICDWLESVKHGYGREGPSITQHQYQYRRARATAPLHGCNGGPIPNEHV